MADRSASIFPVDGFPLWWHTQATMPFLRVRRRGRRRYYYVVANRRSGGSVRQKILQYLGESPDPARVERALAYWEEEAMANRKFGARVFRLKGDTALVKQTYNVGGDRYKVHTKPLSGDHREKFVPNIRRVRELGRAVRAALEGKL